MVGHMEHDIENVLAVLIKGQTAFVARTSTLLRFIVGNS